MQSKCIEDGQTPPILDIKKEVYISAGLLLSLKNRVKTQKTHIGRPARDAVATGAGDNYAIKTSSFLVIVKIL